jgi:hypothetical protein
MPDVANRTVRLVHPWALAERGKEDVAIGVFHRAFHERRPWSQHRWSFVLSRMAAVTDAIWVGDLDDLEPAIRSARQVECTATLNSGYAKALPRLCHSVLPAPRAFPDPPVLQRSFSQFWQKVSDAAG